MRFHLFGFFGKSLVPILIVSLLPSPVALAAQGLADPGFPDTVGVTLERFGRTIEVSRVENGYAYRDPNDPTFSGLITGAQVAAAGVTVLDDSPDNILAAFTAPRESSGGLVYRVSGSFEENSSRFRGEFRLLNGDLVSPAQIVVHGGWLPPVESQSAGKIIGELVKMAAVALFSALFTELVDGDDGEGNGGNGEDPCNGWAKECADSCKPLCSSAKCNSNSGEKTCDCKSCS